MGAPPLPPARLGDRLTEAANDGPKFILTPFLPSLLRFALCVRLMPAEGIA